MLTTAAAFLSLFLNLVFLYLLKFTNVMRGPTGYPGPIGMTGRCGCDCQDKR